MPAQSANFEPGRFRPKSTYFGRFQGETPNVGVGVRRIPMEAGKLESCLRAHTDAIMATPPSPN